MHKKHIYFLINSLEGGGAERVVRTLVEALAYDPTLHVTLITLKPLKNTALPQSVSHHSLSSITNTLLVHLAFPLLVYRCKQHFRTARYTNGVSFLELSNIVHILAKKNALISFRTNISVFSGISGRVYKALIRFFYPKAGRIVVNSEENRHEVMKYLNLSPDRVTTIYNPMPAEAQTKRSLGDIPEPYRKYFDDPSTTVFITIGRCIPSKRVDLILRALGAVKKSGKTNFLFLILGEGPLHNQLRQICHEEDIVEQVVFCGYQQNVFPFLQHSDCFLFASHAEGYPNVLIEASAARLPIITTNFISGAKECMEVPRTTHITSPTPCPGGYILPNDPDEAVIANMAQVLTTVDAKTIKNTVSLDKYESTTIVQQRKQILNLI